MNKVLKTPAGLDCLFELSEEFTTADDDNVCTAPIMAKRYGVGKYFNTRNLDAEFGDYTSSGNFRKKSTGPVKDQGCWRTRYNFELYRLYKEPQVIRSNRLRWLGHIWRSPENNQTRTYTFKNPMGSRTRGRPPTRWIDDVENDLKTLNIKNWRRVAAYRWNWRKRAVEAAKTRNRLLRL
ncbi:endonuclease-reverse transcriptase [Trichonephila clavipes]|nr:endonuclease-reverse transcriptase [Trichonephila clavipes]